MQVTCDFKTTNYDLTSFLNLQSFLIMVVLLPTNYFVLLLYENDFFGTDFIYLNLLQHTVKTQSTRQ